VVPGCTGGGEHRRGEVPEAVPISIAAESVRARRAHDVPEVEGEVLDLPSLTSTNDENARGVETRTLNLAGAPERDEYKHPLE
jgi:hypothetical protein